jgi:HEAT repeat protein
MPPVMPVSVTPPVIPVPLSAPKAATEERGIDIAPDPLLASKELDVADEDPSNVPSAVLRRLASEDANERAIAVSELGRIGGEDSFREISASFDDPSPEVRNAAARSLYNINPDRAASFTRALREAPPERRRHIGSALASSGLATEAIGHLMGESREKTYDAFSLLFLMSKAGEVQPLMRAVEEHPNSEVRLAVVKLLALSGQQEILPAFRRLAVRGSLPTEVRSAVMEAIYQISSQTPGASA